MPASNKRQQLEEARDRLDQARLNAIRYRDILDIILQEGGVRPRLADDEYEDLMDGLQMTRDQVAQAEEALTAHMAKGVKRAG